MTPRDILGVLMASALLLGCGGGEASDEGPVDPAATASTSGSETPDAEPVVYQPNPVLNVYVQGPDPEPSALAAGVPEDFHASIVVSNTGDDPVEVRFAYIEFEMRTPDGEPVECGDAGNDPVEGPEALEPHQAFTYHASFHCAAPEPGEYDVWTFLSLGAALDQLNDRERFYAGRYTIHAR
jgi:hypothetical protein